MAIVAQTPDILGERQSGQDVRTQNGSALLPLVVACQAVANIVKSSLGPVGLDKMLVDDIGDVTITNDGATILKMLEVEHPAAKVLVELAELQDREVGDGTTSVVILAAELLKRANDLVRNKIHPTSIISGYRVVDAVQGVKTTNARGEVKYPIKSINILKAHGKSAKDSYLLNGYALNTGRAAQGMPTKVAPARIACLDFNLQKTKMQMGVQVLVTDPRELEKIREREADITKERIQKLLKAGANVVLTTKGIDDMSLKACISQLAYFVEAGAIAVRRVRKEDLRHVAKATGATVVTTFADMEGEETFDSSFLGHADEVIEERIADDDVILIKGTKNTSAVSLILRGANDYMLDEMDRALHDALCIVKRTLESTTSGTVDKTEGIEGDEESREEVKGKSVLPFGAVEVKGSTLGKEEGVPDGRQQFNMNWKQQSIKERVVAGGGAVEAALSVYLEYLATTLGSREQLAIAEFAESLLVIPKVLAVNAAKDATELVAKLRAYHHTAQTKADKQHLSSMGLDLSKGTTRNNLEAGVIEPAMSKVKIIQVGKLADLETHGTVLQFSNVSECV
ncbi:T-complex protein 1 subunit alpha [Musa troglodytarum]|uniref:T-complex protein 1 subunit alpha n=1 Tax=Musa troglodytarum TaxID=320322 RepID=A0A9E7EPD0_9LILI|nr:T-complex protein 1 subunit alpha [Musa troglodytarum]